MHNRFNNKHSTLIKVMKELGYKTDEKGTCNGLTGIFIRDVADEVEDVYDERIELMSNPNFTKNLADSKSKSQKIGLATQKYTIEISMFQKLEKVLRKSSASPKLNFNREIQYAKKRRQDAYELEVKKQNFSSMDEKLHECLPFCEAVEISQHPWVYKENLAVDLTQGSIGTISSFVDSIKAKKARKNTRLGAIQIQNKYLHRTMLQAICDKLFNIIKANKLPIVIEIVGMQHTLAIYYKEKVATDSWIFFDSNQMPAYPVPADKISYYILEGLYAGRKMNPATVIDLYFYHAESFVMDEKIESELRGIKGDNFFNKEVITEIQDETKDQAALESILFSFPASLRPELFLNFSADFLSKIINKPIRLLKFFFQNDIKPLLDKLAVTSKSLLNDIKDLEDALVFYKYFGSNEDEVTKPIEEIKRNPDSLFKLNSHYNFSQLAFLLGEKIIDKLLDKEQYPFSSHLNTEEKIFYILFSRFYHLKGIHNVSDAGSIVLEFDKRVTSQWGIERLIYAIKNLEFSYSEDKNYIVIAIHNSDEFKKIILNKLSNSEKPSTNLSQNISGLFARTIPANEGKFNKLNNDLKLAI